MFSYNEVRDDVLRLLTSSIEFAKTEAFITCIKEEGCNMHVAIEQLEARKKDLMTECAVVIAGKPIYTQYHYRVSGFIYIF